MTIVFFDCFSGISGDMVLGALVDALGGREWLDEVGRRLDVDSSRIQVQSCRRGFLSGQGVSVTGLSDDPPQSVDNIVGRITGCGLPERIVNRAVRVVEELVRAEAKVHGSTVSGVHLHETGAVDALVDIVGSAYGLDLLGVKQVYASPLPLGGGIVQCQHGIIPVPAPAVLELCCGVPVYDDGRNKELVTPTGAAILRGLGCSFGDIPVMKIRATAYGCGSRDSGHDELPNVLRLIIGEAEGDGASSVGRDFVVSIEANIDDATPELLAEACDRLMAAGALDTTVVPAVMKRGRSGWHLSVIGPPELKDKLLEALFLCTPTIGARAAIVERCVLPRETVMIESQYGSLRVKIARLNGRVVNVKPEAEDCFKLAVKHGVSSKAVAASAIAASAHLYE